MTLVGIMSELAFPQSVDAASPRENKITAVPISPIAVREIDEQASVSINHTIIETVPRLLPATDRVKHHLEPPTVRVDLFLNVRLAKAKNCSPTQTAELLLANFDHPPTIAFTQEAIDGFVLTAAWPFPAQLDTHSRL